LISGPNNNLTTLKQIFNLRLMLLLAIFSLVMSGIITATYLYQTNKMNRVSISGQLNDLKLRFNDLQRNWTTDANHLLNLVEWSGMMATDDPQRNNRMQAFFSAQEENMGFEGIAIEDQASGKPLFEYWRTVEKPRVQLALQEDQSIWYDDRGGVLYTVEQRYAYPPGRKLHILFLRVWDNAMLHRLSFPDTTTFILLGDRPLLSSAGNLGLKTAPPGNKEYFEQTLNGIRYQEGSVTLNQIRTRDGDLLPLRLALRVPISNFMPITLVLASSIGVTLLFAALLFLVIGRWLSQLGTRLDGLTRASLKFQNEHVGMVTPEIIDLLELAEADKSDQVSVVAQGLSGLMTKAAQRDAEQRAYLQTLDLLQDAVIEFSLSGRLLRATDAWKDLTGNDATEDCNIFDCIHPDDCTSLREQISALIEQNKEQVSIRFRMLRDNDNDKQYWVEGRFAPVSTGETFVSIRGVVRDITNSYLQERQISHMALHDSLTDLPNRVLLEDRMEMAISRASRSGLRVALGFIDLDHFKQVNDSFGHKVGDNMLKQVTKKLHMALRSTDTLSRWGGDEFVVLCPDLNTLEDAREITNKLFAVANEDITIEGTNLPFTFSAGFAVYPDDAENAEMLLSQADRAMFYAKAQGRNNIQFFNTIAAKESGRETFYIQRRLMQAVHNEQIQCWLQPLISAQTGMVIGAEALARWYEPEQGWIPPGVFIPMAENMGQIDKLGQSVWRQALQSLVLLPEQHRLSVNLSKRQLFSNSIVTRLLDDVKNANIDPEQIMLEITESIALSDVAYARERIIELDKKGFGIAIDDFGVGYSSLSQLHEIPADELKLDISFVRRIHEKSGLSMAAAIISIAKALDLECVAEGVEDERTAELLGSMGVEVLQGYYYAKPMPVDDYLSWLAAHPNGN